MVNSKCISRAFIKITFSLFEHLHLYMRTCTHIQTVYLCSGYHCIFPPLPKLSILSLNQNSTRMLNEQRTNEKARFRGKENRLENREKHRHTLGKPVLEQTLGSRLHYCFSTLIAEVLSLGLISKTCIIYIK